MGHSCGYRDKLTLIFLGLNFCGLNGMKIPVICSSEGQVWFSQVLGEQPGVTEKKVERK